MEISMANVISDETIEYVGILAKKRKDVMEIRRCIEFYEMMQQKGKQENVKKSRRASK